MCITQNEPFALLKTFTTPAGAYNHDKPHKGHCFPCHLSDHTTCHRTFSKQEQGDYTPEETLTNPSSCIFAEQEDCQETFAYDWGAIGLGKQHHQELNSSCPLAEETG